MINVFFFLGYIKEKNYMNNSKSNAKPAPPKATKPASKAAVTPEKSAKPAAKTAPAKTTPTKSTPNKKK